MSQFFKGTVGGAAIGNVLGPASSTDNAISRFDGTTGKTLQNSVVVIDDLGNLDSQGTSAGSEKSFINQNNDNTAGSSAKISVLVGGTSAGDVYNEWTVGSSRSYSLGVDNNDSQTFKLTTDASANVDPSTGTSLLEMTSAGQISFPAATLTQYGVMVVGASGLLSSTSAGSAGQVVLGNGAGSVATFADVETAALPIISGATYSTIGGYNTATLSSGVITGCTVSDGGSGTIDVSSGSIMIRTTASDIGDVVSANYAGATGQALTDNSANFVYIDYNGGTPVLSVTTVPNATPQNFVVVAVVYREGTTVHISDVNIPTGQVAQKLGRRLALVDGVTRQTGLAVADAGSQAVSITAGAVWLALTSYNLAAFDSSAAGRWSYYYSDGASGFTEVVSQSQINITQYDDGSGSLATLGSNKYGVHWVYQSIDNEVYVVYGLGSYTLTEAQDVGTRPSLPLQMTSLHAILVAKIIVKKSIVAFTEIQSPFDTAFVSSLASDHSDLSGLQGGAAGEYYHLTSADYTNVNTGLISVTALDNTDSPYTILAADRYLSCDVSSGVLTVDLPNAPATGRVVIVKDSAGNAASNNLTVTTVGGSVTIDGSTSFVMNSAYQSSSFIFNGTTYEKY